MTRFRFVILVAAMIGCAEAPTTAPGRPDLANTHSEALLVSDLALAKSWVALRPGAFAGATHATIHNVGSGTVLEVALTDGRLDPHPVAANVGDTLFVSVLVDTSLAIMAVPVPSKKPPVIVRTEPPPRRLDVPLNVLLQVVFSEPMDPASLHSGTIQLHAEGIEVPAQVKVDSTLTIVTIIPQATLEPAKDYALVVSDGVRDLSGEPLAATQTSPFSTGIGRISYAHGGRVWILDPLALTSVAITPDTPGVIAGYDWSPDRTRIVYSLQHVQHRFLYVMDADGSNRTAVLGGIGPNADWMRNPLWSPDGSSVAFDHLEPGDTAWGISVVDVGNPAYPVRRLTAGPFADHLSAWHPDGSRLGITRAEHVGVSGTPATVALATGEVSAIPGSLQPVLGGTGPTWSANGAYVAVQELLLEDTWPLSPQRTRVLRADGTTAAVGPVGARGSWVGSSLWIADATGLARMTPPDFLPASVWPGPRIWDWALDLASSRLAVLVEITGGSELLLVAPGLSEPSLLLRLGGGLLPTGLRWIR